MRAVASHYFRLAFSLAPSILRRRLCFLSSGLLLGFLFSFFIDNAAHGQVSDSQVRQPSPDVVVMINPLAPDVTAIGVAYSKRVSRRRVKEDIKRLTDTAGWKLTGAITITDESADPTRPQVPITTAARLIVSSAPQVIGNAPLVTPYVRAFQSCHYLELVFLLPVLTPYQGITQYETAALSVNLIKDEGVYRYEVEIRDHTAIVPRLADGNAQSPIRNVASPPTVNKISNPTNMTGGTSFRMWMASLLILVGAVLLAGVSLYSIRQRGTAPPV